MPVLQPVTAAEGTRSLLNAERGKRPSGGGLCVDVLNKQQALCTGQAKLGNVSQAMKQLPSP